MHGCEDMGETEGNVPEQNSRRVRATGEGGQITFSLLQGKAPAALYKPSFPGMTALLAASPKLFLQAVIPRKMRMPILLIPSERTRKTE